MSGLPRFSSLLTRWVIATAMACVVLAWPLHEARHVSETLRDVVQIDVASTVGVGDIDGADDGANDGAGQVGKPCVWCMFHGEHYLDVGAPPSLAFHAEASAPPSAAPCGRPAGRCPLAAEPRGPPRG